MSDKAAYRVLKGADNFTMTRCRIETDRPVAISLEGVDRPAITDNIISGSPVGVEMDGVTNAKVEGNRIDWSPETQAQDAADPERPARRQPYRAQRPARRS